MSRSQTYETRMNAAVKAGDWAGARRVWEDQFQSRWRLDPRSGSWEARDGGGQKLTPDQVEQHRSKLESWLKGKMASTTQKSSSTEEEETPLERRKVSSRSASAFQDTASVLSARPPASVRNAFVPSAVVQGSAQPIKPSSERAPFEPSEAERAHSSAVAPESARLHREEAILPPPSSARRSESVAPPKSVEPPPSQARPTPIPEEEVAERVPVKIETLQAETEEDAETAIEEPAVAPIEEPKAMESVSLVVPSAESIVLSSQPQRTLPSVNADSLNVAGESAFVGRRIVSAFDPKALPSASEIDALQALQYHVYKVSSAEWNRLAASGPLVLVDPCMRPATTFLLMKHSKSGALVRVYPDGKPATGAMDWREICVVFEELFPHVSVDLDTLCKAVRSKSSSGLKKKL